MNRHKSPSIRHAGRGFLALLVLSGLLLVTTGCGLLGPGEWQVAPVFLPPAAKPAISEQEAEQVLRQYAKTVNQATRALDAKYVAKAESGSALQVRAAQYKIWKANDVDLSTLSYTAALGATPKFMVHPKWFFAAATDSGSSSPTRDMLVFVQSRPDQPWRVVYAPWSTRASGPLGSGIDVADVPETVPLDDPGLAIAPKDLAAAHSAVISQGKKSASAPLFAAGRWVTGRQERIGKFRKVYRDTHWNGTYQPKPAALPTYAVRTKSGGALVWYAIDYRGDYRAGSRADTLRWQDSGWGDLFKPFLGRSTISKRLRSLEREEMVAYVPPKGDGKIRVIAGRWCLINMTGG